MRFTIYQESRLGKRRNNEDRIAYCYSRDALLMIVADGMGGHYYGEVAAQIAVQTLSEAFQHRARPRLPDPFLFLQRALDNAHHAILDFAAAHRLDDSPRTTCVACVIQDNVAYWAHAGDSRLYLLRDGRVHSATRDHSRVRQLVDQGLISESQMTRHPERNKVYSCLGGPQPPEIAYSRKTPLAGGDVILLASDGFWSALPPELLAVALRQADLMQAVPKLIDKAETGGGAYCDNLSVVAARWQDSYVEAAPSTISTQTMALDEVATRLDPFGRQPPARTDLSDEEIEGAIEEIRAAIEKYAAKK